VPFPAPFAKPCFQHASNFLVYLSFLKISQFPLAKRRQRRYNNRRFKIKNCRKDWYQIGNGTSALLG